MTAACMVLTPSLSAIYVGGNINGAMMLLKINTSSGTLGF
jgi:hypothetical protein